MKNLQKIIFGVFVMLIFCVTFSSFEKKKPDFFVTKGFPKPVYDFKKNPLDERKILLGRVLFYDPILSHDSTISCNSCHSQYTAFTHVDHALSHGIAGKVGNRNSPSLMNLAWAKSLMWDGAINHLDMQALAPISNKLEMDETIENVVKKLQHQKFYRENFYAAFNDSTITGQHVLQAIAQFMLTLVSANSKYDKVKRGEEKFSDNELSGYKLFKKNCEACHTEPLFTNGMFENNGLPVDAELNDMGRMKITKDKNDSLKFKVPTLRNVQYSAPYMHDGRFKNLNQVLNFYSMGLEHNKTLSPILLNRKIYFNTDEKENLISFLMTLSDKEFLYDTRFSYPKR